MLLNSFLVAQQQYFIISYIFFHCTLFRRLPQLLLAQFGSNLKQRVLETYTTDYNYHHDICPGNICPGDICPYQQYLSCYWPDLDQTLNKGSWEHIQQITTVTTTFVQATFVLGTFVHISNISAVTGPIWIKF